MAIGSWQEARLAAQAGEARLQLGSDGLPIAMRRLARAWRSGVTSPTPRRSRTPWSACWARSSSRPCPHSCVRLIVAFASGSPVPPADPIHRGLGASVGRSGHAGRRRCHLGRSGTRVGAPHHRSVIFVARAYALSVTRAQRPSAGRAPSAGDRVPASAHRPELVKTDLSRRQGAASAPAQAEVVADDEPDPPHALQRPAHPRPASPCHDRRRQRPMGRARPRDTVDPGRRRRRRAALGRADRPAPHDHQLAERGRHRARHETRGSPSPTRPPCTCSACASDEELLGHPIQDKLDAAASPPVPIDFASMVDKQFVAQDADATLGPPDGDTLDIAYSITPLRAEGAHVGAVLVLRDVTERRAFQDELTRRALHDELTGLPNRRLLLERLDHALARSSTHRPQPWTAVPRPRPLQAGQRLLRPPDRRQAADPGRSNRLLSGLSPADSVARMSGDEFIVLVEDVTEMTASHRRRRASAAACCRSRSRSTATTSSCRRRSASASPSADQGRDEVLAPIDAATYAAKAAGRNCYTRLDRRLRRRGPRSPRPRGQPAPRPRRGRARAALPADRHRRRRRGRRCRGAGPLAVAAARRALAAAVRPGRRGDRPDRPDGALGARGGLPRRARLDAAHTPIARRSRVSVNLSALQFAQHRLAEDVAETLRVDRAARLQLCLEITETVLMSDTASTQSTLDALHALGVSVAIDDFGTGYSSLSYLKKFAIDVVKLDRTFIEGLVTDPVDAEIASAVIRLSARSASAPSPRASRPTASGRCWSSSAARSSRATSRRGRCSPTTSPPSGTPTSSPRSSATRSRTSPTCSSTAR